MTKILIYSLSCLLLFSGCTKKSRAPSDRANRMRSKVTQNTQVPDTTLTPAPTPSTTPAASPDIKPAPSAAAPVKAGTGSENSTSGDGDIPYTPPVSSGSRAAKAAEKKAEETVVTSGSAAVGENKISPPAVDSKDDPKVKPAAATTPDVTDAPAKKAASADTSAPATKLDSEGQPVAPATPQTETDDSAAKPDVADAKQVVLTAEETKEIEAVIKTNLGNDRFKKIGIPAVPTGSELKDISIDVKGTFDALSFAVMKKDQKVIEFKEFKLITDAQTKIKQNNYNLIGMCANPNCEIVFISVYKVENNKVLENYPALLKWSGMDYLPAQRMDDHN